MKAWTWGHRQGTERNDALGMRADLEIFSQKLVSAGECVNPLIFTSSFCGPLDPEGHSLTENTSFGRFSVSPQYHDYPAIVDRIQDLGRLTAIFVRFELLDFSIWSICRRKARWLPMPIWPSCLSIAAEWDRLVAEYIYKTCRLFRRCQEAAMAKKLPFHRIDKQPTAQHTLTSTFPH
jgi:hypothetical protein